MNDLFDNNQNSGGIVSDTGTSGTGLNLRPDGMTISTVPGAPTFGPAGMTISDAPGQPMRILSGISLSAPIGAPQLTPSPPVMPSATGNALSSGLDLADFGGNATLSYLTNSSNTDGPHGASDGVHSAAVAMLGQYIAGSFALSGADSHGGTLNYDPLPTGQLLTHPHA